METYTLFYRCRSCGGAFDQYEFSMEADAIAVLNEIVDRDMPARGKIGGKIVHRCGAGLTGIADLIGVRGKR